MELYYLLGKGLVSVFVGLTSLILPSSTTPSNTKLPEISLPPAIKPAAQISVPTPIPTAILTALSTTSIASPTPSAPSTPNTKPKTITIYLNYPEKITIKPAKTVNVNFNKIFQYSLQGTTTATQNIPTTTNTSPISLPTVSNISREQKIKNSIVNIFCSIQNGKNVKVVTGSGVIIDPQGIVLTNAHVGQFPLLQNSSIAQNMSCSIRTGSPVNKTYGVKALYVSKDWITTNYKNISQTNFSETGENDIAILYIVDKATGSPTGKIFDYLPLSPSVPSIGDQISIASYPANLLGSNGVNALLTVQTEQLRISDAFNFSYTNSGTTDLIETSDSLQAQHGSSGGALLDSANNLAGIIVITVNGNNPLLKHARALTIQHINNVLQKDTGKTISSFSSQNAEITAQQFEYSKADLVQKLINGSASLFFQQ